MFVATLEGPENIGSTCRNSCFCEKCAQAAHCICLSATEFGRWKSWRREVGGRSRSLSVLSAQHSMSKDAIANAAMIGPRPCGS